jgi:hypothetical protein
LSAACCLLLVVCWPFIAHGAHTRRMLAVRSHAACSRHPVHSSSHATFGSLPKPSVPIRAPIGVRRTAEATRIFGDAGVRPDGCRSGSESPGAPHSPQPGSPATDPMSASDEPATSSLPSTPRICKHLAALLMWAVYGCTPPSLASKCTGIALFVALEEPLCFSPQGARGSPATVPTARPRPRPTSGRELRAKRQVALRRNLAQGTATLLLDRRLRLLWWQTAQPPAARIRIPSRGMFRSSQPADSPHLRVRLHRIAAMPDPPRHAPSMPGAATRPRAVRLRPNRLRARSGQGSPSRISQCG